MHILFTRFPLESQFGGAEVQTVSLLKGLRGKGHEISFLGSCPTLLEQCSALHVPRSALDIDPPPVTKWGAVSFLWRQIFMKKKLINALHEKRVTSNEQRALFMLSLSEKLLLTKWATQNGIRVFWIEHDRIGRWLKKNPWLPRLRALSRLATTIVVSDISKRMYLDLGWNAKDIVTIPNGIDLKRFQMTNHRLQKDSKQRITDPNSTHYKLQTTHFHIGCIARLSPEKGVDLLVEAVKDIPDIQLTIVGTGKDEQHIRQLMNQSTNTSIHLVPSVPDIADFYHSLDLFILPSRDHDPCPLAPIEAMACGIPTILTNVCGTAEYIENGKEAIIVPANSAKALHDAILGILRDDQRKTLAINGKEAANKKFSFTRMIDQYDSVLKNGKL